jgi:hypothetical protein
MQVTPLAKQWNKLTADQIDNDALSGKRVHPNLAGALGYYLKKRVSSAEEICLS